MVPLNFEELGWTQLGDVKGWSIQSREQQHQFILCSLLSHAPLAESYMVFQSPTHGKLCNCAPQWVNVLMPPFNVYEHYLFVRVSRDEHGAVGSSPGRGGQELVTAITAGRRMTSPWWRTCMFNPSACFPLSQRVVLYRLIVLQYNDYKSLKYYWKCPTDALLLTELVSRYFIFLHWKSAKES